MDSETLLLLLLLLKYTPLDASSLWLGHKNCNLKLASFKGDQRPYCSNAASHVDAAVLAHVACVVGLQTDAVVVTETRLNVCFCYSL